ncbi:MAG: hypothetical protein Q9222_003143 [Ikaeria aurantiellina]
MPGGGGQSAKGAKCVVWTLEWVHKNGSREIAQCPDSLPLDTAYTKLNKTKASHNGKPEVKEPKRPSKRRKRTEDASQPVLPAPRDGTEDPKERLAPINAPSTPAGTSSNPKALADSSTIPVNSSATEEDLLHKDQSVPPVAPSQPPATPTPQLHFYLLLPSTPTSYRVLIPLAPSSTLSTALTDHLVLEFPTIYALKQPPDRLPTGFMTEEDYLKGLARESHQNGHLDSLLEEAQIFEYRNGGNERDQDVNEGALRDVLKKDLITVVDTG